MDITELQSTYISLERQLVTQRLMLNIHSSVFEDSNRSCWKLRILGCTLQEGILYRYNTVLGLRQQFNPTPWEQQCLLPAVVYMYIYAM